jgi:hypothetical protein
VTSSVLRPASRVEARCTSDRALALLKEYGEAFFVLSGEEIGPREV